MIPLPPLRPEAAKEITILNMMRPVNFLFIVILNIIK
jgi:hypothetical protein